MKKANQPSWLVFFCSRSKKRQLSQSFSIPQSLFDIYTEVESFQKEEQHAVCKRQGE
jgi:hypothetical protein